MLRLQTLSTLLFLTQAISVLAQSPESFVIKGNIVDAENGDPMSFASIFLSSTTYGTTSDSDGNYNLKVIQPGTYDLIIKFSGYKTFIRSIQLFDSSDLEINVVLAPDVRMLQEVIVTGKKDKLWRRNLADFKKGFLGTSEFAQECKILNEEDIDFYFDKENNIYETYAREPLIIENKALGYRIKFVLEEYNVYMSENYIRFSGFPVFEELRDGRKKKKWLKNRELAKNGSVEHFFSALYKNNLEREGYEVHLVKDVDGNRYLDENEIDLYELVVPGSTENSKKLVFENILYITYLNEALPESYKLSRNARLNKNSSNFEYYSDEEQVSQIQMYDDNKSIEFEKTGYVINPLDYLVFGYWGFERVGHMMPIDYRSS